MIIFIKSTSSRYELSVDPDETVASVKERIYKREGIAPSQQDLVYNDLKLANAVFLSAYNVEDGSLLQLFADNSITSLQPTHQADFLCSNHQPKIAISSSPDVEGSASSSPDYSPSVTPLHDDDETTQPNSLRSNLLQRLASVTYPHHTDDTNSSATTKPPPCVYFKKGKCNFGSRCRFSHNNVTREKRKTMKPTSDFDPRNEEVDNRVTSYNVHPDNMFQLSSFSFPSLPDYQQQHNSSSNRRTYSPDGTPSVRFVMRQEESKGIKRTIEDEPKKGTLQYAAKKLLEQRRNSSASPGLSPAQLAPSGAIASASSFEHADPPIISPSLISARTNLALYHQHVGATTDTSSERIGFQSLHTHERRDLNGDGSTAAVAAGASFDVENVLEQLGEMRALWEQLGRKMDDIYSMIAHRRQTQVVDGQPVFPSSSLCDDRKKRKTNDNRVDRTLDCRNTSATNSTAAAGNSEARHREGSSKNCSSQASTNSSAVEDLDIFFT